MPDTLTSSNGTAPSEHDDRMAETLEESTLRQLDEDRKTINAKEVALNRLPLAVRRLTRTQASAVGLWF